MNESINEDLSAGDIFTPKHLENGLDHMEKLMLALKIIIKVNGCEFLLPTAMNCPHIKK